MDEPVIPELFAEPAYGPDGLCGDVLLAPPSFAGWDENLHPGGRPHEPELYMPIVEPAPPDPSFSAAVSALASAGASAGELGCAARELFARINFAATPASPWVPYTGPRGGHGWRNPSTGRIIYGTRQPGLGRGRQAAPGAGTPGAATPGAPKARRADPTAVKAHIAQLLANPSQITSDAIREVKEQLLSMTVAQINTVKKDLGLKASGVKAELAAKVADRALSLATPPPAPTAPSVLHRGANVITGAPAVPSSSGLPAPQPGGEIEWSTGKPQPGTLNSIPFAPAPHHFWEKVQDKDVGEPPPARRIDRVGVMIQEPDGRIWIVKPTNEFGNRTYTMPGGGVEPGLTNQQNALKEVWEETGLQVEITGHLGDFEDSNNRNNGRLYIGRRVGGAPWDAKIESHIIDGKTGKPAAESSEVVLTTPERAGKLLHRTDDLAQLMTVAPVPLDAPTMGRGSEPMKKFVDAIRPAAEAYKQAKQAARQSPGSATLHTVQELRGFNKKPQVVAKNDMDALISQGGHIEVLRGLSADALPNVSATRVAQKLADDFRYGDHFPGYGIFGAGTYTDSTRGHGNIASSYAGGYRGGSGSGSAMLRMAIPKTAKIVKFSELERQVPRAPGMFTDQGSTSGPTRNWRGVQAALAGYDAIHMDKPGYGKDFYVVLNRGVVTVQKEDASGHVIR